MNRTIDMLHQYTYYTIMCYQVPYVYHLVKAVQAAILDWTTEKNYLIWS